MGGHRAASLERWTARGHHGIHEAVEFTADSGMSAGRRIGGAKGCEARNLCFDHSGVVGKMSTMLAGRFSQTLGFRRHGIVVSNSRAKPTTSQRQLPSPISSRQKTDSQLLRGTAPTASDSTQRGRGAEGQRTRAPYHNLLFSFSPFLLCSLFPARNAGVEDRPVLQFRNCGANRCER